MKLAPAGLPVLDLSSTAAASADAAATAEAGGAAGFDGLLAGLLAATELPAAGLLAASDEAAALPATATEAGDGSPPDAQAPVQALLDSVQASQSLGIGLPKDSAASPAPPASPATAAFDGPACATGLRTRATAHARHTPAAIEDSGRQAAERPAADVPGRTERVADQPFSLPAAAAPQAARRAAEHESGSALPGAFAAAQSGTLAVTELPPRQAVLPVAPALHSPAWQQAFGEQVLWSARAELQSASLTLNPPELGPVSVELSLSDGQASASFSSQQPDVRKAIEDALPMLKQMFADAGLQLQYANVGSGQRQPGQDPPTPARQAASPTEAGAPAPLPAAPLAARRGNVLLDTYA